MATLFPFRALRPRPADAARIASVPYDVVTTDEARALAEGNPLSFLRVSRAELELPPETDPHSAPVYQRALENFSALKERALEVEAEAAVYLYRLRMGQHEQVGVAACYSLDEYDAGTIVKHERTRPDKEDDRTRHLITLAAQTGPVFLTYRASSEVAAIAARVTPRAPLFDFSAADAVQHTIWSVTGSDRDALITAFLGIPRLYIADGHHRAASAARARDQLRHRRATSPSLAQDADVDTLLGVAFPDDEVQILAYNRLVKDLRGMSTEQFLDAVGQRFSIVPGPAVPAARGDIAMYVQDAWRTLRPRSKPDPADAIAALDVSLLQDQLLAPVLGIADVRTDTRIEFVGGARGVAALEQAVTSGRAAAAFSLFPVSVAELMAVSDAGAIMPPKSTWFEPKLRDGLLIHVI